MFTGDYCFGQSTIAISVKLDVAWFFFLFLRRGRGITFQFEAFKESILEDSINSVFVSHWLKICQENYLKFNSTSILRRS